METNRGTVWTPNINGMQVQLNDKQVYRSATESNIMEIFNGNADLRATIMNGREFYAGKIINGKVFLELPSTLESSYLVPWTGISISPPTEVARVFSFNVYVNGKSIGFLQYSKDTWVNGWDVEKELNQISFHYYPIDCTVTGNGSFTWGSVTVNGGTNLTAQKGWNMIFSYGTYNKDIDPFNANRETTTDISKVPAGMNWVIRF